MHTTDYILNDVKPLEMSGSLKKIQEAFRRTPYSHLPVLDSEVYYGALNRGEFELIKDPDFKLQDHRSLLLPFYATETMNWFEVLQYFATYNTNIMPILNAEKEYLGYFELLWNHCEHRFGHNNYQGENLPRVEDLNPALIIDEVSKFAKKNAYVSAGYSLGKLLAGNMPNRLLIL